MCRIAGFIDFNYKNDYNIEKTIISMRDELSYGGPDDAGIYVEKNKGLALGHRRLSVIDLSSLGHQPMSNEGGRLWITYSGEVYNFKEIRKELEALGYRFKSNTDTEVVLNAYDKWGRDSVHKFRGMFAFAIWDKKEEKLILCRDRVGVKPLYWYFKNDIFMFSSELKAFHKHHKFDKSLDKKALSLYLQHGYITEPYSIFKSTYKLEPGHYLEINKARKISKYRYWNMEDYYVQGEKERKKWLKRSEDDVAEELENILTDSFKLRMVSDVPVGIFLSGGIDSSLVTALLQKEHQNPLKTFTIGFHEKEYNEAGWAKKVARHLGTDHTELYCTIKEAVDIIPKLPELYDEPFGDSSAIPTYLVSKLAKTKVKVSLSADGGDELFCGYNTYVMLSGMVKKINRIPLNARNRIADLLDVINPDLASRAYDNLRIFLPKFANVREKYIKLRKILRHTDTYTQYLNAINFFADKELKELNLPEPYGVDFKLANLSTFDDISKMMLTDFVNVLPGDMLVKIDRATMAVALEGRDPFLDHRIAEYAAKLPVDFKYKKNTGKYILRKILYKYVPQHLVDRPKQGFGIPVNLWCKSELKSFYLEYMNEARIKKEGIFDHKHVNYLLNLYINGKDVDPSKLWFILCFQMWKEKWHV